MPEFPIVPSISFSRTPKRGFVIQYNTLLDYLMERDFSDIPSISVTTMRSLLSEHIDSLMEDNIDLDAQLTDILLADLPPGAIFQSVSVSPNASQMVRYGNCSVQVPLVLVKYSY